jgi:hypothetical protein
MAHLVQLVQLLLLVPYFQVFQVYLQVLENLVDPEFQDSLVNQNLLLDLDFLMGLVVPGVLQVQATLEHHCFQECPLVPGLLSFLVRLSIQMVLLDPVGLVDHFVQCRQLVQEHQQYLDFQVFQVLQVGLCLLQDLLVLSPQDFHLAQQAQRVLLVPKHQPHPSVQKILGVLGYL